MPERTVERLSEYRRTLLKRYGERVSHIYSHELAGLHGLTAVQVRRDLMLIGFSSDTKKGYNIKDLINFIADILDGPDIMKVAVVGMGKIASAITLYFNGKRSKLRIVCSFDNDPEKIGKEIGGVPCYPIADFEKKIEELGIRIMILTVPAQAVPNIMNRVIHSPIKGILNFTSTNLNLPKGSGVFVEDYDIITLLEKVAYSTKERDHADI